MKKMIRNLHVVLLSLFMILGSFTPVMAESKEFDEFMKEETNKVLDADFTAFHYGVMDYEKFVLTVRISVDRVVRLAFYMITD